MKKVSILLLIIATALLVGCTDSKREKLFNYGNEFKVEMYSGCQLVKVAGDIVITNND